MSHADFDTVPMIPIGVIRTPFKSAVGTPIQGALSGNEEGEIMLSPAFQEGLSDLDGFSHIVLIYAFHQMEGFKLKVKPYLDEDERGVFATRAPCRPNPIGLSVVRLLGIEGSVLRVQNLDVVDGTPLLDIKPYVPMFDHHSADRVGWLASAGRRVEHARSDDRFRHGGRQGREQ